ncbi:MAG: hypothetical protein JSU58_01915 [Dehalococcoidales bacterium]|nr:MAG: hypothetical protein JSU58_01915 [Dehalococcoidales bacterium]
MIPKVIHSRWESERIENIHDKQSVAERYGWQMVDPLIEMEIDRRNWVQDRSWSLMLFPVRGRICFNLGSNNETPLNTAPEMVKKEKPILD